MGADDAWPDASIEGVLPAMAMGEPNQLFCASEEIFRQFPDYQNITHYYAAQSGGSWLITGEIFPIQVPVRYVPETGSNFFSRQRQMNQEAIAWIAAHYPDYDWSRFDLRQNGPAYQRDNSGSGPDRVLDYVVFMHREFGSTGMGATGMISVPGTSYTIRDGHTGIRSYPDAEHNWEYFKHEFAHNLYDCPHYLGANSADGSRFYTQKGWGLMAAWHAPFFTANAWERWWLGWLAPQEIRQPGRYRLADMASAQDAIRIPLSAAGDYLWIENHQKRDVWDDKLFYKDSARGQPQSAPGIYCYVVAAPGSRRESPALNAFGLREVNMIKMYNGAGNFDYEFRGDSVQIESLRLPAVYPARPNPIAGQNEFQFIRQDYNGDGRIGIGFRHGNLDPGGREEVDVWAVFREGRPVCAWNCTGDEEDALSTGDTLGLNGIFPLLNYPEFRRDSQRLDPFLLNGLEIVIGAQLPDGSYWLDIRFDGWQIGKSLRFCGEMRLGEQLAGPRFPKLRLRSGAALLLDLSGTPAREALHPLTGTFCPPTRLTVADSCGLRVEKGAELRLSQHSILVFEQGSYLRLDRGAKVVVEPGCQLIFREGSHLIREASGRKVREIEGRALFEGAP